MMTEPPIAPGAGAPTQDALASPHPIRGDEPPVLELFGPAYPLVAEFATLLADEGVKRGLIGPREVPRLWERHLINSASVAPFLPARGTLIDVGSGAGLPGIVLAAMRPDLHVVLLEAMERRAAWLRDVVDALGLASVDVVRGRAEELHGTLAAESVTARAVAPLERLVGWTLPLLRSGGVLLAMKGERAAAELEAAASTIRSLGGGQGEVLSAATLPGLPGTSVVRVVRELVVPTRAPRSGRATSRRVAGAPGGR